MNLGNQELLRRAVPPLARKFGLTKEEGWEILNNQDGVLDQLFSQRGEPELHYRVNVWWGEHRAEFLGLGLGILSRVSKASKVSPSTYDQLICLMWLTEALRAERIRRRLGFRFRAPKVGEIPTIPTAPVRLRASFWQRVVEWFRNILRRR